jgi:hypothetical protein
MLLLITDLYVASNPLHRKVEILFRSKVPQNLHTVDPKIEIFDQPNRYYL